MEDKRLYMMAVLLEKRNSEAPDVQEVFTKYGECILSRLGIHECAASEGLISLNIRADEDIMERFGDELTSIKGVTVKYMAVK